ncbi:hypothetical protein Gorai_014654 [Gossypium raimondii]|uniref:Reverse transcriptase zinc-binding domain-containing protein n=1 Tax=Gossypium raimondii TaxID=29730 RepID=A0A7J8P438_GOSRA|nr:hypothetical protein [Gossypium raimondii]
MILLSSNTPLDQRHFYSDLFGMNVINQLDNYLGLPLTESNGRSRGWSMLAWAKFVIQKAWGLGFRDLHLFNMALLGRQVCRLIYFKDTLCYKVVSSKYFPSGDIFHPKNFYKPSYTWTNIAIATKTLTNGFVWLVGDGTNIEICSDNWGFKGLNDDSLCPTLLSENERFAHPFQRHMCYKVLSSKYFPSGDIFHPKNVDKPSYTWTSIATATKTLAWFCLVVGHNILPTYANISSIRQNFNKVCPRCGEKEETFIHALKDCPKAQAILTIGGLYNRLLKGDYSRCINWIQDIMRVLDMKVVADFFTTLWNT